MNAAAPLRLAAGIHDGIPAEVYHRDPAPEPSLSNSILTVLANKTPVQAWLKHPRLNPAYASEDGAAFDIGEVCHALLLQSEDRVSVIDASDWKTKDARDEADSARALGLIPLLPKQYEAVQRMRDAARRFIDRSRTLRGVMDGSRAEQTLVWQRDGIWCRARLDLLARDRPLILDYKTTAADSPDVWVDRYMSKHGCDTQHVWYRRGLAATAGVRADFYFLVQETRPPYLCYLVEPTESMHELGSVKVERGFNLWRKCLALNDWPGYPTEPFLAEAPSWAMRKEML